MLFILCPYIQYTTLHYRSLHVTKQLPVFVIVDSLLVNTTITSKSLVIIEAPEASKLPQCSKVLRGFY